MALPVTVSLRSTYPAIAATMPDDDLDTLIAAWTRALDLPVDPAWRATIGFNLDVTLRLAALVTSFPLPDDAEPAPVFRA